MQLEEFRKKKAAERAKKTSNSSQANNSDDNLNKKQSSEVENVRINEFDGVTTSDGVGGAGTDSSSLGIGNDKTQNLFSQSSNQGSLAGKTSFARNDLSTPTNLVEANSNTDEYNRYNALVTESADFSQNNETNNVNDIYGISSGATNHQTVPLHPQESQDFDSNASQFSLHGMKDDQSNKSSSSLKDYAVTNNLTSYFPSKSIPQNSVDALQQIKLTNSSTSDSGYSHNSLSGGNSLFFYLLL